MLKLGFDIDEVISHLTPLLSEYLKSRWNINFNFSTINIADILNMEFTKDPELNKKIGQDLIDTANDPIFQNRAKPIDGAQKVIEKYSIDNEIYFITSRPISKDGFNRTKIWLGDNEFPYDFIYHTGHNIEKGIVAKELQLDFFVEDRVKHVNSLLKYGDNTMWKKGIVILRKPWNIHRIVVFSKSNTTIRRYDNWNEIDNHLETFGE